MSLDVTSENLYILRAELVVWMPVKLSKPWQDSPVIIQVSPETHWKNTKNSLFGLIIDVVAVIIALTATAATAELAVHEEIQTAEFIRDWHQHSTELWAQQSRIDNEIVTEIANLRQTEILMGDQLEILKEQIKMWLEYCILLYYTFKF